MYTNAYIIIVYIGECERVYVCVYYVYNIPTHIFRSITVVCGYRHTFSVSNDANMNGEKNRLKKLADINVFLRFFLFFFPGNTVMYTRRSEKRTKRSRETKSHLSINVACVYHTRRLEPYTYLRCHDADRSISIRSADPNATRACE